MGRPLFRLAGEDLRKRPAGTLPPRFPHLPRTPPNPSVRVHAACVLALGPFDIGPFALAGHRIGPAQRTMRPADRRSAPIRLQRLQPDRPADPRTPSRCRLRAATPARRAIAPPPVDAGEGVGQRRARTVAGLPVVGDPVRRRPQDARRQPVHPNRGQAREAVVADNPVRTGHARVRRPADSPVARPHLAARRGKTDAPQPAVRGRHDPVPHPAAGGTAPALGMMAFHHRFPASPLGVGDRIQPDLAEVRKRTGQVGVGPAVGRAGNPVTERRRRRRGQRNTDTVGQSAGDAPGGVGARLSGDVMPTLASAQLAGKRCPGTTAVNAGRPEPFDRIGREMSKFGLHAMLCGTELDLLQVWNVDRPGALSRVRPPGSVRPGRTAGPSPPASAHRVRRRPRCGLAGRPRTTRRPWRRSSWPRGRRRGRPAGPRFGFRKRFSAG